MSSIQLKSANLPTSVSRNKIREAVEHAFITLHLYQPNGSAPNAHKKAARKKTAKKK